MLAIPILILTLIFGALVITATPFSKVIDLIKSLFSGAAIRSQEHLMKGESGN